ncbi:MAG TPA: phage tail protein, partial [Acidobacteriaceae bacterium]|nr:phage tail protein [Acidobacteriaceae bacterium]
LTTAQTQTLAGFGQNTGNAVVGKGETCTVGEILLNAGYVANGIPANGQKLSINQNIPLFALIGTTYGGDGITTFAIPDLRSVTPNHMTYSICNVGVFPSEN